MRRTLGVLLANLLVTALLFEGLLATLFSVPPLAIAVGSPLHLLYRVAERRLIQLDPAAARWDPEVTYTLRPGEFEFANLEFRTRVSVNSLGLRDDEASLHGPELIVLGDSQAMGWGVEQDETYASLLEAASGMRVLNAGISSFGTVRELRLLDRIDTSRLRLLVVHYSENDLRENREFARSGALRTLDRAAYEQAVSDHQASRRYWPGKYGLAAARILGARVRDAIRPRPAGTRRPEDDARRGEYFLRALAAASRVDLAALRVLVLEPVDRDADRWEGDFFERLRAAQAAAGIPTPTLETVRLAHALTPECFFRVDGHLNAEGHRRVAQELLLHLGLDAESRGGR